MDSVNKPIETECYTPSSEPFLFYTNYGDLEDNLLLSRMVRISIKRGFLFP
jgi:hypothetical protein